MTHTAEGESTSYLNVPGKRVMDLQGNSWIIQLLSLSKLQNEKKTIREDLNVESSRRLKDHLVGRQIN